jgi:predicted AlkP superfamily pyrophosphatase or phosphodiesterase
MKHWAKWTGAWSLLSAAACAQPQAAGPVSPVQTERATPTPPGPIRHVVLVTIDGLLPDSYLHPDAHGLRVPTLRRFVAEGAVSEGALSTFPSVTYPAHTTIATGVLPARHGIVGNRSFDPLEQNREAWFWYAEELKVKPLWQLAYEAGYQTALVSWPVTVGAQATWLWPEYWRAQNIEDLKLLRALATPGLAARVEQNFPGHAQRAAPPDTADSANVDVASQILREGTPTLLMLHIFEVDGAQHKHGVWSPEATAAIENADTQLARLVSAVDKAGILASTAFVLASDHGFANVGRQRNPNALLREAGFIQLNDKGKVSAWKASSLVAGAAAYVYVNGDDPTVAQQVTELFRTRAAAADSGIAHVWTRADIAARGGDPRATLALEAELGVTFGPLTTSFETKPIAAGMHGYDPERPEMRASLVLLGPSIPHGQLRDARLVDIAPTIAQWLALPARDFAFDGRPLSIAAAVAGPEPLPNKPLAVSAQNP